MSFDEDKLIKDAKSIYIMYLLTLFFAFFAILGFTLANKNSNEAPEWLETHYQFQIGTFWIGALYFIICLSFVLIGIKLSGTISLVFLGSAVAGSILIAIWLIVRCINGIRYLNRQEEYPNPTSWFF